MSINCIVIEDEPFALKKIASFIEQVDYLRLMEKFDNAVDAIGYLKQNTVDLIFLDIRMKRLSGIQFLETIQNKPKVIITSAYDEYALKGYELDVADYLLKPFTFERFLKSVDKVSEQLKNKVAPDYIFVKTEYRIEKIFLDDILFIKGMKDYLQIHTPEKKIMTLLTFKHIMGSLSSTEFLRVHNSYLVSLSKIESVERNRIKIGDDLLPISDSYRDQFFEELRKRNLII